MMKKVTFLLVVGVASLAVVDSGILLSPGLHGTVSHLQPLHHGSLMHHESTAHHVDHLHHESPVHLVSPVHHSSTVHHVDHLHHESPVYHASPVHHVDHLHHESPVHFVSAVHHDNPGYHAQPVHHSGSGYGQETYEHIPVHSNFDYNVHDEYSGTHFGHQEARDGYKTEGKYFVNLPDGRLQTVTYYADETGYHPTVSYEGEATHYDSHAAPNSSPYHGVGVHISPTPYHEPEPFYHAPQIAIH